MANPTKRDGRHKDLSYDFIENFTKSSDLVQAYRDTYNAPPDYHKLGKTLNDPVFMQMVLELSTTKRGLTDDYLITQLKEGLDSLEWESAVDASIKIKIIDMLLKLKGRYISDRKIETHYNKTENVTVVNDKEIYKQIQKRLQEELSDSEIEILDSSSPRSKLIKNEELFDDGEKEGSIQKREDLEVQSKKDSGGWQDKREALD